jgi:hypothetical protein
MKIIITEEQYNDIIPIKYKRRIVSIINTAEEIIDNGDFFWEDVDFCHSFPSFSGFIVSLVEDTINQYMERGEDYDISEFIYDMVGEEKFIILLLESLGGKIGQFYKGRTQDCR